MNHESSDADPQARTFIGPLNRKQILFGGEAVTPYREGSDAIGEVATRNAINSIAETIGNVVLQQRIVEYKAMLRYFELAAGEHDGSVPIEEIRSLLRDMLQARK